MQDITLDVKFEKDIEKQYAILEGNQTEEYGMKMLQSNKLAGMLEVQIKNIDNKKWYYYNITKKSSLEYLLEQKRISLKHVEIILVQIFQAIKTAKDFLLDERNLILEEKMIYLSSDNLSITEICYYPSYQKDNIEQLIKLLEVFLNKIDYGAEEKNKVEQLYSIYDKARETGMTCQELCKEFQKQYNYKEKRLDIERKGKSADERVEGKIKNGNTMNQPEPAFYFERAKSKEEQSDGYEQNIQNGLSQYTEHTSTIGKSVLKKQKSEKLEVGKGDIQKKQSQRKKIEQMNKKNEQIDTKKEQQSVFGIKNLFVLSFIIVFSSVIISIALFTNIFRDSVTGTVQYNKFGILCVIVAAMDLFAWKYLRKEKSEKDISHWDKISEQIPDKTPAQVPNKMTDNNKFTEKRNKGLKSGKEELASIIGKLEKSDIGCKRELQYHQPADGGLIENEFWREEENTVLLMQEQTTILQSIEKAWKLVCLEEGKTMEIPLTKFPFYLGKLNWNVDYAIEHSSISRVHSKFEKEGDILYVRDLDSTNGTYLNHIRLGKDEKQQMNEGDEISFADIKFRLEVDR